MLVVRVELWPGGRESQRRTIATMDIGNASFLADESDYQVIAHEEGASHLGIERCTQTFGIKGHNRKQSVWALIEKCAKMAFQAKENKGIRKVNQQGAGTPC